MNEIEKFQLGQINKCGLLIQKIIKIVEELSENEIADIDGDLFEENDIKNIEKLKTLIIKARSITSDYCFNELKN